MSALLLALALAQDPLKTALEEAKRELAAEEERIRKEEAAQEADLAAARTALANLVDEHADRTRALAAKTKELEALRAERAKVRPARDAAKQSAAELRRVAEDARRKIADLLDAVPPSEHRPEQRGRLLALKMALDAPGGEVPDLRPLVQLFSSLLVETRSVEVFPLRVRNADGAEELTDGLRAGMAFTGWVGKTGRQGIAIAAPSGEQGWRWNEALPGWAKADLAAALAAARAGARELTLPLDPTQQLSIERRLGARSAWDFLKAGGMVMVPLGVVALLAVLLAIERAVFLSRQASGASVLGEAVLASCRQGLAAEAEKLAGSRGTPLGRTLAACLARREQPAAAMEDAVQEQILHELPRLERFLSILGILTGVAPMLGLLGTVTGMMTTFDMITVLGSGDPGIMAGGIYEALITTVAGLVVAIPLLLVHGWLSGRVDRIVGDLERYSASLVNLLRRNGHGRAE